MVTNNISPDGNGPRKSIFTVCHGLGGNRVGCNGAGGFGSLTSWQGKQELINSSVNLSMFGNQVFSLMRDLVLLLLRLKWPWCAVFKALFRSDFGNTSRFRFKRTLSFFFFEDVEKKVGLKSPKLHTPR